MGEAILATSKSASKLAQSKRFARYAAGGQSSARQRLECGSLLPLLERRTKPGALPPELPPAAGLMSEAAAPPPEPN